MRFTVTDTETNIQDLMDAEGYRIDSQRFNNKISFRICHTTSGSQMYLSGAGVIKSSLPEPLQTDTKPIESGEIVVYEDVSLRLDKIRIQAGVGQSIEVYVDIRA